MGNNDCNASSFYAYSAKICMFIIISILHVCNPQSNSQGEGTVGIFTEMLAEVRPHRFVEVSL